MLARAVMALFICSFSVFPALAQNTREALEPQGINTDKANLPINALASMCDQDNLILALPDSTVFLAKDDSSREALISALRDAETTCLKSPSYYAKLGEYYLLQGRANEAIEVLERSLLIMPEQPGVQMDFALALAEIGDLVSAQTLINQLMARGDMPSGLKSALENLKNNRSKDLSSIVRGEGKEKSLEKSPSASLAQKVNGGILNQKDQTNQSDYRSRSDQTGQQNEGKWAFSGNVQALLGHDNNLNSASFVNTVNLTLPNGVVPLTLDPSSLPQSGSTRVGTAQWIAQRPLGDGQLIVGASWMGRQTPGNPGLGFHNEELMVHLRPKDDLGWHQRGVLNHFEVGASNFYNGVAFSAWNELNALGLARVLWGFEGTCHFRMGFDADKRTYAQDPSQNGFYGGLSLGSVCARKTDQFNLSFQEGIDWASDGFRAGGNQKRQELKVQWLHSLEKGRLGLEIGQQWLKDSTAYSDLLGGIERNTQRSNARMSFYYPMDEFLGMISKSLYWVSSIERQSYRSTISLFNLRGESIQTGLKWEF